jgi:hypothetical protein
MLGVLLAASGWLEYCLPERGDDLRVELGACHPVEYANRGGGVEAVCVGPVRDHGG